MSVSVFDRLPDGREVHLVELGAAPGPVLRLLTLGATVHDLEVTGGDGTRRHVALGHATSADYLASGDYVGATVGRYANRVRDGHLPLAGVEHRLGTHDRGHHLHGGPDGFDRRLWTLLDEDGATARLRLVSPDGDQGYPGELTAEVTFAVDADAVRIDLAATTDATTVVNLTQHVYLNLDGRDAGTVDGHLLQVPAASYTPVDAEGIPLGAHAAVEGTPFDLRRPTRIGSAVRRAHPQVLDARGLDHNLVLDSPWDDDGLRTACVLTSPATRTALTLRCDQPGLQVYTGNFLDGTRGSVDGGLYRQGDGVALEPQLFPDSPHHPEWPSARLEPGERYTARHEWRFSAVR
ncbi:galactose mutarotase [Nocardioides dongxiaopingii]|uniref:aldose epimerase family protein n=1 Tax=Nocardioides sp. S-1144 TaxID=2582905 RepID=UPI001163D2D1|nr:aldose epimerase family protein [Nocardioides sp. S-1144]QCW49555.2 galactose mutarotase [Nocardioides sp. S-1144]